MIRNKTFKKLSLLYFQIYFSLQAISKNEEGIYSCYSRGINRENIKIDKIHLIVEQEYEEVYEHDHNVSTNLLRNRFLDTFVCL